jgi:hypothetical protein
MEKVCTKIRLQLHDIAKPVAGKRPAALAGDMKGSTKIRGMIQG